MPTPDLDLLRGTLDLLILKTLGWGPMHGLGVLRWIEQVSRSGLSRDDAERRAREAFGDEARWRRETRHIDDRLFLERRRIDALDALRRESRLALRALARSRSFALIAILTLALGIGA